MTFHWKKFFWSPESRTLSADASDIFGRGRVPNAFQVEGVRETRTFRYSRTVRDVEGDVLWDLYSDGKIELYIFND